MLVKNVIRGNSVTFTSSFLDANNVALVPSEPLLSVYYKSNNVYLTTNVVMTGVNSTSWSATWNSSNADVGIVQWHISAGTGTPVAEDGDFRILANRANGGPGAT